MAKVNNIEEINSDADFDQKFEDSVAKEQRVCVDFTASWCGPCKAIAPIFINMSKQYNNVRFWKVDFDKCKETVGKYSIQAVPTFLFFFGGKLVRKHTGAAQQKLVDGVKVLSEKGKEELLSKAADNTTAEAEATRGIFAVFWICQEANA